MLAFKTSEQSVPENKAMQIDCGHSAKRLQVWALMFASDSGISVGRITSSTYKINTEEPE
jgi:hypothetical protein